MSEGTMVRKCATCSMDPAWYLERRGDAAVTWACRGHLSGILSDLQRGFEITEVVVKSVERMKSLEKI